MTDAEKTVMVVDDDTAFLDEMQEMLTTNGYRTVVASDCSQALALANTARPDAFLLDLKLGTASGFQLALQLRHAPETAGVPIIAMTGHFNVDTCGRLISYCGIAACLEKPFHPRDVIRAVNRVTGQSPNANKQ